MSKEFRTMLSAAIESGVVAPLMRTAWENNYSLAAESTEGLLSLLLDQAEATPPAETASVPPWRDTRPLDSPPEPWNDSHWQRDSRRAEAAEVALSRNEWEQYANVGLDAVAVLVQERDMQRQIDADRGESTQRAIDDARALREKRGGIEGYMQEHFGPARGIKQGPVENGIGTVYGGALEF